MHDHLAWAIYRRPRGQDRSEFFPAWPATLGSRELSLVCGADGSERFYPPDFLNSLLPSYVTRPREDFTRNARQQPNTRIGCVSLGLHGGFDGPDRFSRLDYLATGGVSRTYENIALGRRLVGALTLRFGMPLEDDKPRVMAKFLISERAGDPVVRDYQVHLDPLCRFPREAPEDLFLPNCLSYERLLGAQQTLQDGVRLSTPAMESLVTTVEYTLDRRVN